MVLRKLSSKLFILRQIKKLNLIENIAFGFKYQDAILCFLLLLH